VLAAADVNTGEWHQFTEKNTAFSDLHQAALSSGSIPGVFPPQVWNGTAYMDGGTIWNINIDGAIKGCMEKGFAEEEILLDIALCYYYAVDTEPAVSKNAFSNYMENTHIRMFYSGITNTYEEMQAYPKVNFRYYMMNTHPALGLKMLDFETSNTWPLQEWGRADAAAAVAAGPGVGFQAVKNWQENVGNVKDKFAHFGDYYRHHTQI